MILRVIGGLMADTKGTVLVIDDEEPVRQVASEILKFLGYSVLTAPSGDEAIQTVKSGARPDVVLLDLIMPGLTGSQTLAKLREIEPDLPVLISTGYADRAASESLTSDGASGFVNKPYHIETLGKELEKAQRESKRRK